MALAPAVADLAHTIQLAVTPVFLLAGAAGVLNVLAGRLGRVVDRARALEREFTPLSDPVHGRQVWELRLLDRRIWLANWAIFLVTASTVLVCAVVAALFVAQLAGLGFARVMAVLFVVAMLLLIAGLALFLVEVRIASRTIRVRDELLERQGRTR